MASTLPRSVRDWIVIALAVLVITFTTGLLIQQKKPLLLLSLETAPVKELDAHRHHIDDAVGDHGHGVMVYSDEVITTEDLWVRGVQADVINAPRVVLHHLTISITPPVAPDTSAPAGEQFLGARRILRSGQDVAGTVLLPKPYASFVPKGSRISISAMLHNPLPPKGPGGQYSNVFLRVGFLGLDFPAKQAVQSSSVSLMLVDKDSATGDTFTVPPHITEYVRASSDPNDIGRSTFRFPTSGTLVGLGGHIHAWEGGDRLEVELNGKRIHSFIPRLEDEGPWDWHTDYQPMLLRVAAGDVLTISAIYSNPSDKAERGAMGIVLANFAPDSESR
ncbi:MAG TPA: hypothetical protein VEB18_00315 [Candidatus Paceibacterota bacterium]|nr:hypothetical protein [Candidatus Paceibacterota bacterium]